MSQVQRGGMLRVAHHVSKQGMIRSRSRGALLFLAVTWNSSRTLGVFLLLAHAAAGQNPAGNTFLQRNLPTHSRSTLAQVRRPPSEGLQLYRWSIVALAAANIADVRSTWSRPELNPVLGAPPRFGVGSLAVKAGLFGGAMLFQSRVLHRTTAFRRSFTWVNFVAAGGLGAVTVRNQAQAARR